MKSNYRVKQLKSKDKTTTLMRRERIRELMKEITYRLRKLGIGKKVCLECANIKPIRALILPPHATGTLNPLRYLLNFKTLRFITI